MQKCPQTPPVNILIGYQLGLIAGTDRDNFYKHLEICKYCHLKVEGVKLGLEIQFEKKREK